MKLLVVALLVISIGMALLAVWRWTDLRADHSTWERLAGTARTLPRRFDPEQVAALPDPARRYFLFAIRPGTPLHTAATIAMTGEIGLGPKDAPNYLSMRAEQILAPPHGLLWKVSAGTGWLRLAGSDGLEGDRSWSRFWLFGLIPIVRVGDSGDHRRSAFGRLVAEAAFWTPAALLPQDGITWDAVDADTARATVVSHNVTQTVDIRVDDEGRPLWVSIPRWSNANPDKIYREQPFGGFLSDYRDFDGFRIPTQVEGGNFFGTADYFPFYRAIVTDLQFLTR